MSIRTALAVTLAVLWAIWAPEMLRFFFLPLYRDRWWCVDAAVTIFFAGFTPSILLIAWRRP